MVHAVLILTALSMLAPPSGRPPTGPLQRYEPRLYDVGFQVQVSTVEVRDASLKKTMLLENTPVVMPLIFQSTWSRTFPDSLGARMWFESREDSELNARSRIDDGFPFNTHLAVMPIERFEGQALRWQITFRTQVWSSRIDDAAAATIAWPREWPKEVQDGLQRQMFVESDLPLFAQAVQTASKGQLRLVPPYLAAKDLVRYCIENVQVSGDGLDRRELGFLHGMELVGAARAADRQRGGPHDLVCVCVATLRAAGIPARAVIGVEEVQRRRRDGQLSERVEFVSWAEFYLPEAGWIPFDPVVMRGKGIRTRDVHEPWPEFGTMDDLNRRVPLAYHFMPPAFVQSPQAPAVWGWDPRPAGVPSSEQFVTLSLTHKGRAPDDPAEGR